jgi:hypothetical protein
MSRRLPNVRHAAPASNDVVIGPASSELRRLVGPVAWSVLEHLHLVAALTDDRLVARASTRSLARDLDIGKDTAARALIALRQHDLVDLYAARTDDGRFSQSTYVLTAPPDAHPHRHPVRRTTTSTLKAPTGASRNPDNGRGTVAPTHRSTHASPRAVTDHLHAYGRINESRLLSSRTCISDARMVDAGPTRRTKRRPVSPCPERSDTAPC